MWVVWVQVAVIVGVIAQIVVSSILHRLEQTSEAYRHMKLRVTDAELVVFVLWLILSHPMQDKYFISICSFIAFLFALAYLV